MADTYEPRVEWYGSSMFNLTSRVFEICWPLFAWKVRANAVDKLLERKVVEGFLLVVWFAAMTSKLRSESAELWMGLLACSTTQDDQERFTQLVKVRHHVAKCYDGLKQSNLMVRVYLEFMAKKRSPNKSYLFRQVDGGMDLQWLDDLKQPILIYLAELQKKLDAIKEDLNEELQVTIGTVQVRDAQLMREQTEVTAHQTKWTVALTVLAAVYLPMTLVTGIFGMNITEISSEATAPNARWVVCSWMVVAGLTVAGMLSYVAIDKRRAGKRKSDLEANNEGENNNVKGKAEGGKWDVESSKGSFRWLKQKAKMVWARKQE